MASIDALQLLEYESLQTFGLDGIYDVLRADVMNIDGLAKVIRLHKGSLQDRANNRAARLMRRWLELRLVLVENVEELWEMEARAISKHFPLFSDDLARQGLPPFLKAKLLDDFRCVSAHEELTRHARHEIKEEGQLREHELCRKFADALKRLARI